METKTAEKLTRDINDCRIIGRWALGLSASVGILDVLPLHEDWSPRAMNIMTAAVGVGGLSLYRTYRNRRLAAEHQLHGQVEAEAPLPARPISIAAPIPVD